MLNIWVGRNYIPKNLQFIYDPDSINSFIKLDNSDEFVILVLNKIEKATIQDDETFIDRFGRGLFKQYLSTTTKILLGVRQNVNFCINISEIGLNSLPLLFKLTNGNIWLPNNNRDLHYYGNSIMLNGFECNRYNFEEKYMEVSYENG